MYKVRESGLMTFLWHSETFSKIIFWTYFQGLRTDKDFNVGSL